MDFLDLFFDRMFGFLKNKRNPEKTLEIVKVSVYNGFIGTTSIENTIVE